LSNRLQKYVLFLNLRHETNKIRTGYPALNQGLQSL
jgi:hypothetical protein